MFLCSILIFIVLTSISLFSQDWQLQAEGLASRWQAIDAVDSNIAAAVAWGRHDSGGEAIFRTLNGGKTWQEIPWLAEYPGLIDICITDSFNIWVATEEIIACTSNSGTHWAVFSPGDNYFMSYIEMFDSLNGIAEADAPLEGLPVQIFITNDGGKNWNAHSCFPKALLTDYWRGIDFLSMQVGYASFRYYDVPNDSVFLKKTNDGGITWQTTALPAGDAFVVRFYDEKIGLATAPDNKPVQRTLDGGETWESFPIDSHNGWPNDIEFFPGDPARVLAVFGSALFFSEDTGRTWQEISTPDIRIFRDIAIADSKHAWIVGEGGIIHTSTGGYITSVPENEPNIAKDFVLLQNYPNPFNSSTIIRFSLKARDKVSLKIYNLIGEEVAVLANGKIFPPGNHSVLFDANNLASGIYLCRFSCSQGPAIQRMVLLR